MAIRLELHRDRCPFYWCRGTRAHARFVVSPTSEPGRMGWFAYLGRRLGGFDSIDSPEPRRAKGGGFASVVGDNDYASTVGDNVESLAGGSINGAPPADF